MNKMSYFLMCLLLAVSSCKKGSAPKVPLEGNEAVLPDFSWAGSSIAPAEITFTNLTKNATSHQWDFNNGTTSSKEQPGKVTFVTPGAYTVTLKAANKSHNVFTSRVLLITTDDNPIASFSYGFKNKISYAPATVQFVNESANATSYEWDINGRKDNVKSPIDYIFSTAGTYKAKLVAINGSKRSAVFEQDIIIEANPNPVAKFAVGKTPGGYFVGQEIYLINQSTNSDSYLWNFGIGGPADTSIEHAVVKFAKAGKHTIRLVSKKGNLTSKPYTITILVKDI